MFFETSYRFSSLMMTDREVETVTRFKNYFQEFIVRNLDNIFFKTIIILQTLIINIITHFFPPGVLHVSLSVLYSSLLLPVQVAFFLFKSSVTMLILPERLNNFTLFNLIPGHLLLH